MKTLQNPQCPPPSDFHRATFSRPIAKCWSKMTHQNTSQSPPKHAEFLLHWRCGDVVRALSNPSRRKAQTAGFLCKPRGDGGARDGRGGRRAGRAGLSHGNPTCLTGTGDTPSETDRSGNLPRPTPDQSSSASCCCIPTCPAHRQLAAQQRPSSVKMAMPRISAPKDFPSQ